MMHLSARDGDALTVLFCEQEGSVRASWMVTARAPGTVVAHTAWCVTQGFPVRETDLNFTLI